MRSLPRENVSPAVPLPHPAPAGGWAGLEPARKAPRASAERSREKARSPALLLTEGRRVEYRPGRAGAAVPAADRRRARGGTHAAKGRRARCRGTRAGISAAGAGLRIRHRQADGEERCQSRRQRLGAQQQKRECAGAQPVPAGTTRLRRGAPGAGRWCSRPPVGARDPARHAWPCGLAVGRWPRRRVGTGMRPSRRAYPLRAERGLAGDTAASVGQRGTVARRTGSVHSSGR